MEVFQTCKEMLLARSYTIREVDEEEWTLIGVKGFDEVGLFILPDKKLNIELLKQYCECIEEMNLNHAILVYQQGVTSSVKKNILNVIARIELFAFTELKYNILNHSLVPLHTKVGSTRVNSKKYPILKRSDAVARFMGYVHGDIIRIDRKDGTIYFRYVK